MAGEFVAGIGVKGGLTVDSRKSKAEFAGVGYLNDPAAASGHAETLRRLGDASA